MAIGWRTVMSSIAALSVSGVTIKDVDEVPEDVTGLGSIFMPLAAFITDFRVEPQSYGGGESALMDIYYTLNYRFYLAPVAAGRGFLSVLDLLVDKLALLLDALIAIGVITGAEGIRPVAISNYGTVFDPSDNQFWGCDIAIEILEFGPND